MSKNTKLRDDKMPNEEESRDRVKQWVKQRVVQLEHSKRQKDDAQQPRSELSGLFLHAAMAQSALSVDHNNPDDKLVADAFEEFGLEPKEPYHWRILVEALLKMTLKRAGAPEVWSESRYFDLQIDLHELAKAYPDARGNQKLAELLRSRPPFKSKYSSYEVGYLRKRIAKAKDPKFNPWANYDPDESMFEFVVAREKHLSGMSETQIKDFMQDAIVELIINDNPALRDYLRLPGRPDEEALNEAIRRRAATIWDIFKETSDER